uniref:Uncharacterized protein n=1 Tax=Electrophorus electricus TaxID=8005 RepID=A0A4W4FS27_ELEEL
MADVSISVEDLQCSICLDVFTDPVPAPCGHNFCMVCLKESWGSSSLCQCPVCKEEFSKRPEMHLNTFISELVAQFKKSVQMKSTSNPQKTVTCLAEVQQMIKNRLKKIEEKTTEKEKADSMEVFSSLVCCIKRSQAELLQVLEEKQEAAERQAEEFIKELQQEITELKRRDTELEIQQYTGVWFLTGHMTKYIQHVFTTTHCTLLNGFKLCLFLSVDVTLDPDAAHPDLILSVDGKQVTYGDKRQYLSENPKRFDVHIYVLGKEGFSSGRFYYEVQVRGKTGWVLGVAKESIKRKGDIKLEPKNGYWTVWRSKENEYKAPDSFVVPLSLKQAPQKVGVFVDYEEGLVSFYDVEARSHIYSFTGQSFTEKLYPLFNPCNKDGGKNSAPLVIMPVETFM